MMIQQTLDKLYAMKLDGMADSLKEQMANPQASELWHHRRSDHSGRDPGPAGPQCLSDTDGRGVDEEEALPICRG